MCIDKILEDINKKDLIEIEFTYNYGGKSEIISQKNIKHKIKKISKKIKKFRNLELKINLTDEYDIWDTHDRKRYYIVENKNKEDKYKSFIISYTIKDYPRYLNLPGRGS